MFNPISYIELKIFETFRVNFVEDAKSISLCLILSQIRYQTLEFHCIVPDN